MNDDNVKISIAATDAVKVNALVRYTDEMLEEDVAAGGDRAQLEMLTDGYLQANGVNNPAAHAPASLYSNVDVKLLKGLVAWEIPECDNSGYFTLVGRADLDKVEEDADTTTAQSGRRLLDSNGNTKHMHRQERFDKANKLHEDELVALKTSIDRHEARKLTKSESRKHKRSAKKMSHSRSLMSPKERDPIMENGRNLMSEKIHTRRLNANLENKHGRRLMSNGNGRQLQSSWPRPWLEEYINDQIAKETYCKQDFDWLGSMEDVGFTQEKAKEAELVFDETNGTIATINNRDGSVTTINTYQGGSWTKTRGFPNNYGYYTESGVYSQWEYNYETQEYEPSDGKNTYTGFGYEKWVVDDSEYSTQMAQMYPGMGGGWWQQIRSTSTTVEHTGRIMTWQSNQEEYWWSDNTFELDGSTRYSYTQYRPNYNGLLRSRNEEYNAVEGYNITNVNDEEAYVTREFTRRERNGDYIRETNNVDGGMRSMVGKADGSYSEVSTEGDGSTRRKVSDGKNTYVNTVTRADGAYFLNGFNDDKKLEYIVESYGSAFGNDKAVHDTSRLDDAVIVKTAVPDYGSSCFYELYPRETRIVFVVLKRDTGRIERKLDVGFGGKIYTNVEDNGNNQVIGTQGDGSYTSLQFDHQYGTFGTIVVNSNGSNMTSYEHEDGSQDTTSNTASGDNILSVRYADGSSWTVITKPDGTTTRTETQASMNTATKSVPAPTPQPTESPTMTFIKPGVQNRRRLLQQNGTSANATAGNNSAPQVTTVTNADGTQTVTTSVGNNDSALVTTNKPMAPKSDGSACGNFRAEVGDFYELTGNLILGPMERLHYTSCNMVANLQPMQWLLDETMTLSKAMKTLSTLLRGVSNMPNYGYMIKTLEKMFADLDRGQLQGLATNLNNFKNDLGPLTDELTITAIRIQNYAKKLLMATNVSQPQTVEVLTLSKQCPEVEDVKELCVWETGQHATVNKNLRDLNHDIFSYSDVHTHAHTL
jgi:hypothetical protein